MSKSLLNEIQEINSRFYGRNIDKMPKLIAEGRTPFSVADLMKIKSEARTVSNAPKAVRNLLLYDYFDTRDAFVRPAHPNGIVKNGRAKIVLDAQQLIGLTPKSESSLSDGALILPEGIYEELEGLDLSRRDLRKYASEEWKKKEELKSNPILQFLARDRNLLEEFLDIVVFSEGYDRAMAVYIAPAQDAPTMRSVCICGSRDSRFSIDCRVHLDDKSGRLFGRYNAEK